MDSEKKERRNKDDDSDDDTASSSSGPINAKRTRLCYNKNDIKNVEIVVGDIVPEIEEILQQNNLTKVSDFSSQLCRTNSELHICTKFMSYHFRGVLIPSLIIEIICLYEIVCIIRFCRILLMIL